MVLIFGCREEAKNHFVFGGAILKMSLRDRIEFGDNDMLVTLAVIGALAIIAWFIRALGLKRISVEFSDRQQLITRNELLENEDPPKQLNK